ncbi:hypothetical protein Tco_0722813 [Tanacetum coccineum]
MSLLDGRSKKEGILEPQTTLLLQFFTKMSQLSNDEFSQHLSDDEESNMRLHSDIGDKEEYDIWAMEMEHYLEYIDNEVWKVIQNGNSKKRISTGKDGIVRILSPVTAAEIQAVEKERKGSEYPADGYSQGAYEKKAVFKQQFEAFKISSTEGLEKGYDRFQQLLSQLEAHGAEVSTEDANHKFLRFFCPQQWDNAERTSETHLSKSRSWEQEKNRWLMTMDDGSVIAEKTYAGLSNPLSGDYTPSPQDEIDESLYVYGKKGPQEPEPSVSNDRSSEFSTCQSNDSAGSIGISSEHSVDLDIRDSRSTSVVRIRTALMEENRGSAVKTSASYNWRNYRPNSNCDSGPTFIRIVNVKCNTPKMGRSGIWVGECYFIDQQHEIRERPLYESFKIDTLD